MGHIYNTDFYDYIEQGSRQSAKAVISILSTEIDITSLVDIGCGRGAWLSEWKASGIKDLIGIDGDYIVRDDFHVDHKEHFRPQDISTPFDLARMFDIAQCLEVAEHLPEKSAKNLIKSIVRHSDIVIFSAAQPGQGGEDHINEKPLEYWRSIFESHGFSAFDFLRPLLKDNEKVMPWYKYNTIIYANKTGQTRLSENVKASYVKNEEKIPAGGNIKWRLRRFVVRLLPRFFVNQIAISNAKRIASALT